MIDEFAGEACCAECGNGRGAIRNASVWTSDDEGFLPVRGGHFVEFALSLDFGVSKTG